MYIFYRKELFNSEVSTKSNVSSRVKNDDKEDKTKKVHFKDGPNSTVEVDP